MYWNTQFGDSKNNNNKGKWLCCCLSYTLHRLRIQYFHLTLIPIEISSSTPLTCCVYNGIILIQLHKKTPVRLHDSIFHVAAHIYSIGRMRIVMQLQFHMTPSTTYAPHYGTSSHFHSKISRIHKFRAFVFSLAFCSGQWICLNFELKTSSLVSKNSISIYVESQLN